MKTPTQKAKAPVEGRAKRGRPRSTPTADVQCISDDEMRSDRNNDEDSQKSQELSTPQTSHPPRGRPPKMRRESIGQLQQSPKSSRLPSISPKKVTPAMRRKQEELALQHLQRIQAESFVMKLFDRSLDLSKYTECTELYPLCRAWMANQPRNPSIQCCRNRRTPSPVKRENNADEMLAALRNGDMREVTAMPTPDKAQLPRIPSVAELEGCKTESDEDIKYESSSREELLAVHKLKWKRIKHNWVKHMRRYQKRYERNHLILAEVFKS